MSDRIVELTDALLSGELSPNDLASQQLNAEEETVLALRRMIAPQDKVSPAFRQKLTQNLNQAWEEERYKTSKPNSKILGFPRQVLAAAASILIVGFAILLVVATSSGDADSPTGTASGSMDILPFLAGVGVTLSLIGVAVLFWNYFTDRS